MGVLVWDASLYMHTNPLTLVGIRPNVPVSYRISVLTLLKTSHMMLRGFR